MDDAEVEGRRRRVAASYLGPGDHLHIRRVRAGREDLARARHVGDLIEAVSGAEIGIVVVTGDSQVLAAQIERAVDVERARNAASRRVAEVEGRRGVDGDVAGPLDAVLRRQGAAASLY